MTWLINSVIGSGKNLLSAFSVHFLCSEDPQVTKKELRSAILKNKHNWSKAFRVMLNYVVPVARLHQRRRNQGCD